MLKIYCLKVSLLARSSMWTHPAGIGDTSRELRRSAAGCILGFCVEIRTSDFPVSTSKLPLPGSWPLSLLSYEDRTIFFLKAFCSASKPWECSITISVWWWHRHIPLSVQELEACHTLTGLTNLFLLFWNIVARGVVHNLLWQSGLKYSFLLPITLRDMPAFSLQPASSNFGEIIL